MIQKIDCSEPHRLAPSSTCDVAPSSACDAQSLVGHDALFDPAMHLPANNKKINAISK